MSSSDKDADVGDAKAEEAQGDGKQDAPPATDAKKEEGEGKKEEDEKIVKKMKAGGKKKKGSGGEPMGALAGFEIIGVRERHGKFRKAVPIMPLPLAVLLCVVNVILPGIGTFVSAFTVFCGGRSEYEKASEAFTYNLVASLLQLITLPILVGWIWSIIWGVTFVSIAAPKAAAAPAETNPPEPEQV